MVILGILGVVIVLVGPPAIAAWVASRVRWPAVAFLLAWVLTPLANGFVVVVLTPFVPAGNDGTWAIMLPIYGIGTGLIAAIVAAVIVARRRARHTWPLPAENTTEAS